MKIIVYKIPPGGGGGWGEAKTYLSYGLQACVLRT